MCRFFRMFVHKVWLWVNSDLKMNLLVLQTTLRARAPVDHLRFLDVETVVFGGVEAGCLANSAIDIDCFPAGSADQVMMVVTDAIFEQSGRTSGLDATDDALFHQGAERVVNGLFRNRADLRFYRLRDCIRSAVGTGRHRPHHGKALRRHGQTMFAELGSRVSHV